MLTIGKLRKYLLPWPAASLAMSLLHEKSEHVDVTMACAACCAEKATALASALVDGRYDSRSGDIVGDCSGFKPDFKPMARLMRPYDLPVTGSRITLAMPSSSPCMTNDGGGT